MAGVGLSYRSRRTPYVTRYHRPWRIQCLTALRVPADFGAYLADLRRIREHPEATPELSLRQPLVTLLNNLAGAAVDVIAEVGSAEGQPDLIAKRGPLVVGYGETKAPGTIRQLEAVLDTPQLMAYRRLPNLLLTDYLHFILLRDGVEIRRTNFIHAADLDAGRLARADRTGAHALLSLWLSAEPAQITSSERLAHELARRAAWLRDGIRLELQREREAAAEAGPDGPLAALASFYRTNLMSDLDDVGFSDAFAQTVAYGLFVGRFHLATETFDRRSVLEAIPTSTQFLRSSTRFLLDEASVPRSLSWIIDDLVSVLKAASDGLVQQAGTVKGAESESDAVIHFYEYFLAAYDRGERIDRGIYYTYPPLVSYTVRAVDHALETRFGIGGLADDRVRLLDPAVGTGTFLVAAAERAIARATAEEGEAVVPALIEEHLIPDLFGFELLPAPYAIAHLKLGSFYEQQGRPLRDGERAQVFLTNTLAAPIEPTALGLPAIRALIEEARSADSVKRETPILVIIGNPPYSVASHNHEHISDLIADFFAVDGEALDERNVRPLDDDYLRFLRWSVWKLIEQEGAMGRGVIAFVTNSAFLSRPVARGVRKFMLDRFDEIRVLDLHGNRRDVLRGRRDDNPFPGAKVGISITLFIRHRAEHEGSAAVWYRETRGAVDEKFAYLNGAELDDGQWTEVHPVADFYSFIPRNLDAAYVAWPALDILMPIQSPGVISHRDRLSVGFTEAELLAKIREFADLDIPDGNVEERYDLESNPRWILRRRRAAFGGRVDPAKVKPLNFRPFDLRWIYDDTNVVGDARRPLRGHLERVPGNIALVSARSASPEAAYAFVSRSPGTQALMSSRTVGAAKYFPLYKSSVHTVSGEDELLPLGEAELAATPNIEPTWLARLHVAYGEGFSPERLLAYIYGILISEPYRERFGSALEDAFPRIPLTADAALFITLADQASRLVHLHLMEATVPSQPRLEGAGDLRVGDERYEAETARLWINATQYLAPVSADAWAAKVGHYQPLELWLRNRRGRTLSRAEVSGIALIAASLAAAEAMRPDLEELVSEVLDGEMLTLE